MSVGPAHYAALGAVLFAIGLYGVSARRSTVAAVASLSILLSAPVVVMVGVAEAGSGLLPRLGEAAALVTIAALCANLLVGGAVVALVWRRSDVADLDELIDEDA